MIHIKNLTKNYQQYVYQHKTLKSALLGQKKSEPPTSRPIIKDLTLDIASSEVFCIAGRNGAGKSTLAKLIAGTTYPTSGEITFKGRVVPFLQLGVAFNQELTGLDNLYLNGVLLGLSLRYLSQHKDQIFQFAGVEDCMAMPLKHYSTGMQLRLAFSIARHVDGEVYIFDEILAVGDADFKKKCFLFFDELLAKQKTIIIISHDLHFIKKHADRLLILSPEGEYQLKDKKQIQQLKDL